MNEINTSPTTRPAFWVIFFYLCNKCRAQLMVKTKIDREIDWCQITPFLCQECHSFLLNALDYLGALNTKHRVPDREKVVWLEWHRDRIIASGIISKKRSADEARIYLTAKWGAFNKDDQEGDEDFKNINYHIDMDALSQELTTSDIYRKVANSFADGLPLNAPSASAQCGPRSSIPDTNLDSDWRPLLRAYGYTWKQLQSRRKPVQ